MKCNRCGYESTQNGRFCSNCGNALMTEQPQVTYNKEIYNKKAKNWFKWVIIVVVIGLIVFWGLNFYNKGNILNNDDKYIEMVKNSMSEYNCTYGKVFDDFFVNSNWTYISENVVEFSGEFIYYGEDAKLLIQFKLNDNVSEILTSRVDDTELTEVQLKEILSDIFSLYSQTTEITTIIDEVTETTTVENQVVDLNNGSRSPLSSTEIYDKYVNVLDGYLEKFQGNIDCVFRIYDIDNDGIYELLVSYGSDVNRITEIYTITDGSVVCIGESEGISLTYYEAEDGNGIYEVSCDYYSLSVTISRVNKMSNFITLEELEKKSMSRDYYYNDTKEIASTSVSHYLYNNEPRSKYFGCNVKVKVAAVKSEYLLPTSNSQYLTVNDISGLTKEELRIARNEIYARYGRKFTDTTLQQHFNSCPWYNGTIEPDKFNITLNPYEKANIELIKQEENKR